MECIEQEVLVQGRLMKIQPNLTINSVTVQIIYAQYLAGYYLINRRYQRKLVWSVEEKSRFIDSIVNGYPVPMILGANYSSDDRPTVEVLDGMQRLNAIVSFVEGEFSLNGAFFNLDSILLTKSRKDKGELKQKFPVLSEDECSNFLNYPVPFSIFVESDIGKLDESFRRINTGGKALSKQDVRQAGALGVVPETVNEISSYIRKDSSHSNYVDLRYMKLISLSNVGLDYGISLHDVFWARNNIITYENLRMSRDEELVAHLVACMVDKKKCPA